MKYRSACVLAGLWMVAIAAWPQRGGTDQEWQQAKDLVGAIHGSFSAPPKDLVTVKFKIGRAHV